MTRHLAAFLCAHRDVAMEEGESPTDHDAARPDVVLLNGGLFESSEIRQRIIDVISGWFSADGQTWSPQVLENDRLSLAVGAERPIMAWCDAVKE